MNYRDGRPAQPVPEPASTHPPESLAAPAKGAKKNFRGNEEHPIGSARGAAEKLHEGNPLGAASVTGGALEVCVTAVISGSDLATAARALAGAGVQTWVTVPTPQGPKAVEIAEYLRRLGSA